MCVCALINHIDTVKYICDLPDLPFQQLPKHILTYTERWIDETKLSAYQMFVLSIKVFKKLLAFIQYW